MSAKTICSKICLAMVLAAAFGICLNVSAQANRQSLPTHHVADIVINGTTKPLSSAPDTKLMHLDIMLPLRNEADLTALLTRLYDPNGPDYGNFLSVAEFTARYGPTVEDYQAVVDWAKSKGFTVGDQPANRLLVPITGTVAQVNAAFNVTMNAYQHPTENRTFFSPDREPSVDLSVPLWHIAGLSNYSVPRPLVIRPNAGQSVVEVSGSGPGGNYIPSDMRAAYYGTSTALTGSGQCVGIAEFDGYDISDVAGTFDDGATYSTNGSNYILTYNPPGGGGPYTVPINNVLVDGGSVTPDPDPGEAVAEAEVVLDIAQAIGMAPGLSQVRMYLAPDAFTTASPNYLFPSNSSDSDIFSQMAQENVCKQLSISWNWTPESIVTNDTYFKEMIAQGQDLFSASGDYGSWSNNVHVYPEEDANVTSVGGTSLTTNGSGGPWESETAWSSSGGGVSPDKVPIASYQQLSGFSCSGCSTAYRNGPDVAMEADADNYVCNFGVCSGGWPGTSFAAPRWAGFHALVNQQAVANGLTAGVGFINQGTAITNGIYSIGLSPTYADDFHDITSGSNGAYSAGTGYDLVTGWGSPNGQNLIVALTTTHPVQPYHATGGYCQNNNDQNPPESFDWNLVLNPTASDPSTMVATNTYSYQFSSGQCIWENFAPAGTLSNPAGTSKLSFKVQTTYNCQEDCNVPPETHRAKILTSFGNFVTSASSGPTTYTYTIPAGTDLSTVTVTGTVGAGSAFIASMEMDITALSITY